MLIGVVGFIGSGKDTVADYLVNFHGFRRESFASTLKDAIAAIFGWDRVMLEGRTTQARAWREQVDPWWAERLKIPHLTPRWILQHWGTDVCRRAFHDDVWIASLENKIRNSRDNTVISDCRFPNEIQAIKHTGGIIVWIKRGPLPEWYTDACDMNAGDCCVRYQSAKKAMEARGIHASETAWLGAQIDHSLDNNSTIDDLYKQIKQLAAAAL